MCPLYWTSWVWSLPMPLNWNSSLTGHQCLPKPNGLFSHTSLLRILFEVSAMWGTFDYPLPEIFSSLELQNLTFSVPSLSLQQCPHGALAALQASVVFLSIHIWTAPKPRLPGWTWLLHSGHTFPATWRTSPSTEHPSAPKTKCSRPALSSPPTHASFLPWHPSFCSCLNHHWTNI